MHDLQPVAKGREGGKMNGLGDGTRSDYADSKRLAHRDAPGWKHACLRPIRLPKCERIESVKLHMIAHVLQMRI